LGSPLSGLLRQRPRVPQKLGQLAPTGRRPTLQHRRVGQQTQGAPGQTGRERVSWPGSSVRPGGGDADRDTTRPCSQAADCGGLDFPLRRLTAIRDGRSWRRDTLAGLTMRDDPISRRSVVICAFGNAQPDEKEDYHMNGRRRSYRAMQFRGRRQQPPAVLLAAVRVGAAATGAAAIGAGAVGALAVGRLAVGRAAVRRLKIEDLEVTRLHVHELRVDQQPATAQPPTSSAPST
jgi:hypothetical protein